MSKSKMIKNLKVKRWMNINKQMQTERNHFYPMKQYLRPKTLKSTIGEENITFTNIYAPNNIRAKFIKQKVLGK